MYPNKLGLPITSFRQGGEAETRAAGSFLTNHFGAPGSILTPRPRVLEPESGSLISYPAIGIRWVVESQSLEWVRRILREVD